MAFPYKTVFSRIENSVLVGAGTGPTPAKTKKWLASFKTVRPPRGNDAYFRLLVLIVFYSGFRASTVDGRRAAILRRFSRISSVSKYSRRDVEAMTKDKALIRHPGKISAAVHNAMEVQQVLREHSGSFARYLSSFPSDDELAKDLRRRFEYIGKVTVSHFLMEIGRQTLKPDRVICRIFHRLGLISSVDDINEAVHIGEKFASATGETIRYIDIILVNFGQLKSTGPTGVRGVCRECSPECHRCPVTQYCQYFAHASPLPGA